MAIFYQTGTLNPLSTQLSEDIRQAFKTGMDAAIASGKTKWAVAEHDYVNGTSRRTVYTNTDGFAILIQNSTTLATNGVYFYLGQSYTLATHTLNNLGWGDCNTATTSNSTGFTGTTMNPTTYNQNPANHTGNYYFTATSAQTNWSIHVENEYVYFSFKDGSAANGKWMFAGRHTSMVGNSALTDAYPFSMYVGCNTGTGYNRGVILHSLDNNSVSAIHGPDFWSLAQNTNPAVPGYYDKFSTNPNKAKLSPIYISRSTSTIYTSYASTNHYVYSVPPSTSYLYGWLRGKLPVAYMGGSTSAIWGDTISIGGATYMYIGGILSSHWTGQGGQTSSTGHLALWVAV